MLLTQAPSWLDQFLTPKDLVYVAIGVIATIWASRYFYYKGVRAPRWHMSTNVFMQQRQRTIPDLDVQYRGHTDLDNLSVSVVSFWNAGNQSITAENVAPLDPFRVIPRQGVTILAATVLGDNNAASDFSATFEEGDDVIMLHFDYLKQQQGGVVQVVHTGNDNTSLAVKGEMKESGALRRVIYTGEGRPLAFLGGTLGLGLLGVYVLLNASFLPVGLRFFLASVFFLLGLFVIVASMDPSGRSYENVVVFRLLNALLIKRHMPQSLVRAGAIPNIPQPSRLL